MEQLGFQAIFLTVLLVKGAGAVLVISHKRVAGSRKVGPDLMGPSCDQLHLKKGDASVIPKGTVSGLNGKCSRGFFFLYCYFITFFVFMQITFDIFFVFYDALYQTAVKLVKASVVEKARELLQPGKLNKRNVMRLMRRVDIKKVGVVAGGAAAVLSVMSLTGRYTFYKSIVAGELKRQLAPVNKKLDELKAQNAELKAEVERLQAQQIEEEK